MIAGKAKIKDLIENGLLKDYDDMLLGGAGIDLRLGKIYKILGDAYLGVMKRRTPKVEAIDCSEYILSPGEYVLVETIESVNMPANIAARVLNRSTIFRCGATLINALVDPGYNGKLTFGLKNLSEHEFKIEIGAAIAQIVFEFVEGETTPYDGKYQGGKVV